MHILGQVEEGQAEVGAAVMVGVGESKWYKMMMSKIMMIKRMMYHGRSGWAGHVAPLNLPRA